MVSLQYGWTPIRPGFPLWRKWLGNWLPWSPVDLIGLMSWCSLMRTPFHAPLPREGHLGILPKGGTNRATCRRTSQLEVHQLLQLDSHVIYPVGLNGHEIPLITTLPGSPANGTSLTGGKSIYLEVDIPQFIVEESDQNVSPSGKCPFILMISPAKATPLKLEREVSMTMEVRELLSWAMLDTSSYA